MKTTVADKSPYKSWSGAGVDVASKRADDLDKLCLEHIKAKSTSTVLDIGCGAGGQSLRLALAGAKVLAVDSFDFAAHFQRLRSENLLTEQQLNFVQSPAQLLFATLNKTIFSDVVFQRTLHYLPYSEARIVLSNLHKIVLDRLYISVTGLDSAIGKSYAHADLPLAERFCELPVVPAQTFSIRRPICLYNKTEFITLLENTGWRIDDCWESAFGNIKAVCVR